MLALVPFRVVVLAVTAICVATVGRAHEFWISPQEYMVAPGGQLVADIRVGSNFKGAPQAYLSRNIRRFEIVTQAGAVPVDGCLGDMPALTMPAPAEGLAVIVHVTGDSFLTWRDAQKFVDFVTHKDFAWALDEHAARGLPETGFRERYSRYGKSLVAIGGGAGADHEIGLETEIVALANPYVGDAGGAFPVQVLYRGQPRADAQVEVFARAAGGEVTVSLYRTDAAGRAVVNTEPGTEYLVDAVVMRPLEPIQPNDPVWESLWASLTFFVPER